MNRVVILLFLLSSTLFAKNYNTDPKTRQFIAMMVKKHHFNQKSLQELFANVKVQEVPLSIFGEKKIKTKPSPALARKYPLHGGWDRYVEFILTQKRAHDGAAFIQKHRSAFTKAENTYGVPAEYIAAIIGIESVYGGNVGKYPVFDTLSTLAFEKNRRSDFFKEELEKFLLLSEKNRFNPKNVMGSYAGAIGLGQFMPSNYEAYGVDHNEDGRVSLQHPHDAIASIANYLKQNGWRSGEPVATPAAYEGNRFKRYKTGYERAYDQKTLKGVTSKYGKWHYRDQVRLIKLDRPNHDELWLGAKNFFVITRYNHSAYYAMAAHQLAMKIKAQLQSR